MGNKILTAFAVISVLFLVLIIFAMNIMGDKRCGIQIKNESKSPLTFKTFQFLKYEKEVMTDSLILNQNEEFEIGHCINCSTPDTLDIKFDAIGFYEPNGNFKVLNRRELIDFLEKKEKEDCVTYLFE